VGGRCTKGTIELKACLEVFLDRDFGRGNDSLGVDVLVLSWQGTEEVIGTVCSSGTLCSLSLLSGSNGGGVTCPAVVTV